MGGKMTPKLVLVPNSDMSSWKSFVVKIGSYLVEYNVIWVIWGSGGHFTNIFFLSISVL